MKKQGAIILGIGGDNTATAQGDFYEGVLTSARRPPQRPKPSRRTSLRLGTATDARID